MKTRTNQARLCRFPEQDGSEIEVTYAPVERVLVFRTINGGILPITVKLRDAWELVRKDWVAAMAEAELQSAEKIDPRQAEIPAVVEAFIEDNTKTFSAKMRHALLPQAGVEKLEVSNVQPVQGSEVGTAESAPVCVQEPAEQSETTGPRVQPYVPAVSEFCQ